MDHLIPPYQGELKDLLLNELDAEQLKLDSESFSSITLSQRQQCDLELLLNGAFSPLTGFMNKDVYESVVSTARLPNGVLWPIPYYLDVDEKQAESLEVGKKIALCDTEGFMPAVLAIESIWRPDKNEEALEVYGTLDKQHPGVDYLFNSVKQVYVGGTVHGIQLPFHYDFETLRHTPIQLRQLFDKLGWKNVVAFHTSKPMHCVHQEITMRAADQANAHILIHPVVGMSKPGDIHYYARVHCYQAIMKHYPKSMTELSLLPIAMRMAGPREALMNAIIRQNYGCSHYIVGAEHAAPPNVRDNATRFYATGSSQKYVREFEDELEINIINIDELCYDNDNKHFVTKNRLNKNSHSSQSFSNSNILDAILRGKTLPSWVTYPEVIDVMSRVCPPRSGQGFTLFFTGLSGSGKSTLARIIYAKFIEDGKRPVTLLDGDVVRHNLSSELGFSKKDRDLNVSRIGYVASEITKNRGIAICAPIAPYTEMRRDVRNLIEQYGAFVEIYVATSLEECERRDRKGLYAKARRGLIPEFTGISDPYDVPENPEIRIDTENMSPMQAAQDIYLYLVREGFVTHEIDD
ncbi:MAG: bifunctional sulfate adenylyltransferase/adenylylsulfate kinase [Gammaproteobacteria bacterium]|nr:bifunctional sulfate adenylyltransferase/adenylylsulfate kinase [Gammaproteobacteria bacterium]